MSRVFLFLLFFLVIAGAVPALAHPGHGSSASSEVETRRVTATQDNDRARAYFTDTILVSHTGERLRYYSDILEGRTVVISFIFTTCQDACPLINANLQRVQNRLGDRIGKDILFVSISVDPEVDTVPVLADYRKRYDAGDGWLFLTGSPGNIETVSQKMGQVFEKEAHLTALLVGNTRTARWRKIPAHLSDAVLASQIIDIADGVYD